MPSVRDTPEKWNAYMRDWDAKHREKVLARKKLYYRTHREEVRAKKRIRYQKYKARQFALRLKQSYGLTVEEFEAMWERQKGLCAICEKVLERGTKRYAIDHDHKTGRVRGLLCPVCNVALHCFEIEGWKNKAESFLSSSPFS